MSFGLFYIYLRRLYFKMSSLITSVAQIKSSSSIAGSQNGVKGRQSSGNASAKRTQTYQQSVISNSSPYAATGSGCRQLQPTAKFDSNSRSKDNNDSLSTKVTKFEHRLSLPQLNKSSTHQQKWAKCFPRGSKLLTGSSNLLNNRKKMSIQGPLSTGDDLIQDEDNNPSFQNKIHQQSQEESKSKAGNLTNNQYEEFDSPLINNIGMKDQSASSPESFIQRSMPKPKFQLDQPLMPLDFVATKSPAIKASIESQEQTKDLSAFPTSIVQQEFAFKVEKIEMAQQQNVNMKTDIGSMEELLHSYGAAQQSINELLIKKSLSHQSNPSQLQITFGSNKQDCQLTRLKSSSALHGNSSSHLLQNSNSKRGIDEFSFAGLGTFGNECVKATASQDETHQMNLETLSSNEENKDSPFRNQQMPTPTKQKRQIPSITSKILPILDQNMSIVTKNMTPKSARGNQSSKQCTLMARKRNETQYRIFSKNNDDGIVRDDEQSGQRFMTNPVLDLDEQPVQTLSDSQLSTLPADSQLICTPPGARASVLVKNNTISSGQMATKYTPQQQANSNKKDSDQSQQIGKQVTTMNDVLEQDDTIFKNHISMPNDTRQYSFQKALGKLGQNLRQKSSQVYVSSNLNIKRDDKEITQKQKKVDQLKLKEKNANSASMKQFKCQVLDLQLNLNKESACQTISSPANSSKKPKSSRHNSTINNSRLFTKRTAANKKAKVKAMDQIKKKPLIAVIRGYNNDIRAFNSRNESVQSPIVNEQDRRVSRRTSNFVQKQKLTIKDKATTVSPTKAVMNFLMTTPNLGHQFEPMNEMETTQNSPEINEDQIRSIIAANHVDESKDKSRMKVVQEIKLEEAARGLLSKSLEPTTNRAKLYDRVKKPNVRAAYNDDYNTSQSSINNYMSQTTNPAGMPYMISVVNLDYAGLTEPGTTTLKIKGTSKSRQNWSVGPNDDSVSQISSCRQRRAQYHRLLSLGKHEEVERQISIEMQSNNQDAISLYTRAKLAEKQKNYAQAIIDLGRALELDPTFFNAAYAKAACENIIGRYDDAIETYNLAFTKDIDAPIITNTINSRMSSKRSSPSNMRLSRQASKMLVAGGNSQSPFRLHSLEPCVLASTSSNGGDGGFTSHADEQAATSRHKMEDQIGLWSFDLRHTTAPVGASFPRRGSYAPPTGALASNIIEVDSENTDRSPQMTNEATIGNINVLHKPTELYSLTNTSAAQQDDTTLVQHDDITPCFEVYGRVPSGANNARRRLQKIQHPEPVFAINSINSVEVSVKEEESLIQVDDQQNESSATKGLEEGKPLVEQVANESLKPPQQTLQSALPRHRQNKSNISHNSTNALAQGKKSLLAQSNLTKGSKPAKKGVKRKIKSPQLWPPSVLPSAKRNQFGINNYIPNATASASSQASSLEKMRKTLTAPQPFSISPISMRTAASNGNLQGNTGNGNLQGNTGNGNVTLIGQVNIQLPPPQPQQQFAESPPVKPMSSQARQQLRVPKQPVNRRMASDHSLGAKRQQVQQQPNQVPSQANTGNKDQKQDDKSGHHQQQPPQSSDESLSKMIHVQPSFYTSTASNQNAKSLESHQQEASQPQSAAHVRHSSDDTDGVCMSLNQLRISANPSSQDLSKAYKVLSSQLLKNNNNAKCQSAAPITRLKARSGVNDLKDERDLGDNQVDQDGHQTVDQQPEWFLLAKSSYKLKKYGECLFAVSKAAGAITKRDKLLTSQRVVQSNWNVASPPGQENRSAEDGEPRSDTVFTPDSTSRLNDALAQQKQSHQNAEVLSADDLQGVAEGGPGMDTAKVGAFIDREGNLNQLGQIQLGYLKAKCLCKLKRYSESLFQLARITQMTTGSQDASHQTLTSRQANKILLYKAICLTQTMQYKQAVQILNQMLAKILPEQTDLLDNMRESYFNEKKTFVSQLIQAYSCRGKANQMLQDYEQALQDYNKLIELCQFQDLPTEKVFEYMTTRTAIMGKLSPSKQSQQSK